MSDRKLYQEKLLVYQSFLDELHFLQAQKSGQVKLSNELKERLLQVNQILNKDIYEMNYQLFEDSFPKK